MKVHRLGEVPDADEGRAIAMGTFDGVHLGHRRVIDSAREWARKHGARASVVTFDPPPLQILRRENPPKRLTTTGVKAGLVEQLGMDEMIVIPFTRELSMVEPEAFCRDTLIGRLGARHVSVGENFRFGHGAAGDADFLRARTEFETTVVPLVESSGETVSSSRIRDLVSSGAVREAAKLLGGAFVLEGTVVEGDARGRELGMPTANLEAPPDLVVPAAGIYAARARIGDRENVPAAVSVGVRPTFEDAGEQRVEAHLIGLEGDLYGRTMQLEFLDRLRDEERFDSASELTAQMRKDVQQTLEIVGGSAQPAE
jgi:riboflavin kinase / FMN adenylyltransferase